MVSLPAFDHASSHGPLPLANAWFFPWTSAQQSIGEAQGMAIDRRSSRRIRTKRRGMNPRNHGK
jgi:hypothetical protein